MDEVTRKVGDAIGAVKTMLDAMAADPTVDKRGLAVTRTQFETAFLWAANAVGGEGIFEG
ncbi:hypothetical protein [Sphingopyxis sp. GW247-27LB]|uniref:hypothetical protein n=1 Tax=Sphingopyxis sp. GW247-27LB TaxID=2012632 RepID=UPI000BA6E5B3|nr:hypothetical protein [Sphingopyxis sp. GW247-27LB]PAL20216.1 hypothetical protein CD928_17565 [Sphingopyxis sp. GW247-27LB]